MEDGEPLSLEQIRALVEASEEVQFHCQDRGELYEWVNRTLRQQDYGRLKRSGKGLVRRYVAKMTGLSRAQVTRLIQCYQRGEEVKPRVYRRQSFASRYTSERHCPIAPAQTRALRLSPGARDAHPNRAPATRRPRE